MPWEDNGLAGEGKQFFGDAREEKIVVTAGQIPTPHPSGEEHVSAEQQIRCRVVDTKAPWAMAGHLQDGKGSTQEALFGPLEEFQISLDRLHL